MTYCAFSSTGILDNIIINHVSMYTDFKSAMTFEVKGQGPNDILASQCSSKYSVKQN